MSILNNFKLSLGESNLKKLSARLSRKKSSLDFGTARTMALLFNADNQEEYKLISEYIQQLKKQKKAVKAIGFYNTKKLPADALHTLEFDFFSQEQLDFKLEPTATFSKAFIDTDYDILINCDLQNNFPVKYFAALSKAKFKVGVFGEETQSIYDLMIEITPEKKLKYFLQQVEHYFSIINQTIIK